MNDAKIRAQIHRAVDHYAAENGVREKAYLAQRILCDSHASTGKGSMMMKKKLSVGFVLMLAAMLLTVTALAAGIVMSVMTSRVAEMEAGGQFAAWGLEEKHAFVLAMRESGYDMDESDWAILSDESQPAADREAAADRIVYARYGTVQEEANARRPMPKASVMGEAPDAVLIFRERFLAEHPDATEYDYLDALGYWLRDEYYPQMKAALPSAEPAAPADVSLTKDMAVQDAVSYMTEVFNWPLSAVNKAQIAAEQDEQSGAWHVTATIDAAALQNALGPMIGDATLESSMITVTDGSYVFSFWVTRIDNGDWVRAGSLDELTAAAAEQSRISSLHTIYVDEAEEIAVRAIADRYGLSDAEISRYFIYNGDTYWNDPAFVRVAVLLRTRNNSGAPWDYAAIVNLTTAQVDDIIAAGDMPARAALLAEHWYELQEDEEWLHYLRFFTTWNPYGWIDGMPEDEWLLICDAFRDIALEQQAALSDPDAYFPLKDFLPAE